LTTIGVGGPAVTPLGQAWRVGSDDHQLWNPARADEPGDWLEAATDAVRALDPERRVLAVAVVKDRLPDVERHAVAIAMRRGAYLARIGEALGMSRQAVHKKYGPGAPKPSRPRTRGLIERRLARRRAREDPEQGARELVARFRAEAR
jgi:hypothetical protein